MSGKLRDVRVYFYYSMTMTCMRRTLPPETTPRTRTDSYNSVFYRFTPATTASYVFSTCNSVR